MLGVPKDAAQADIKKAYMKLARVAHPDKGGDPDKFKEIQTAYETLGDPEKREAYDRFGKDGAARGGGPGGMSPEDLMAAMFGGGMRGGRGPSGPRKGEDTVHKLTVSLEDCFHGKTSKLAVNRTITTADPNGQLRDRAGNRYSRRSEREVLEVYVEKGSRDGQRIVFSGKGDVEPGALVSRGEGRGGGGEGRREAGSGRRAGRAPARAGRRRPAATSTTARARSN